MPDEITPSSGQWLMTSDECRPLQMAQQETLFTLANGYAGVRGSLETSPLLANPGFFVAGVFDRVRGDIHEIVNLPCWVGLTAKMDGFDLDVTRGKVLNYERSLDMRQGILWTSFDFRDAAGRTTRWESGRLIDMHRLHSAYIWGSITALDYSGTLTLTSALDAWSVKYGSDSRKSHFDEIGPRKIGPEGVGMTLRTADSGIEVVENAVLNVDADASRSFRRESDLVTESVRFAAAEGQPVDFTKRVSFFTSRDDGDPRENADRELQFTARHPINVLAQSHVQHWDNIWSDADVQIEGDDRAQKAARFNIFHLASLGNPDDPWVSLGAKGLHGTGYRGLVFWDTEQYMVPFFTHTRPAAARALLKYRHNLLGDARENAADVDCPGARIPWNSSISGIEASFNSFGWQEHQTADVAYATDRYLKSTDDREFYLECGAELIVETARFWTGRMDYDENKEQYVLRTIMGTDEIHGDINNNALTNYMARFNLQRAIETTRDLKEAGEWEDFRTRLELDDDEIEIWQQMADNIYTPWSEKHGFHEQFDGYFQREDRLAEQSKPAVTYTGPVLSELEKTQINKQADTVLLYYLFPDDFDVETRRKGYEYYEPRTAHCSSLSRPIYAAVAAELGKTQEAYDLWLRGAEIDYGEDAWCDSGIHAASLGGAWQALVFGFGGFRIVDGRPAFDPQLPEQWDGLRFRVQWRGDAITVEVRQKSFSLTTDRTTIEVLAAGDVREIGPQGLEVGIPNEE